ncbi:dTDP-4-dehydrorhamnose reductase [Amylibacter sp.]|nr:dTDP-4-dehydrorhamnose reductase [Amylibacter sp.]
MNKKKKILIIGSSGQLGQSINAISKNYQDFEFIFLNRFELDLCNQKKINEYFNNKIISIIINCAAYTSVDKAEVEPELADQINNIAVQNLAHLAEKNNIKLIHISTDYVFDGWQCHPYVETDKLNPLCVYGMTKLRGEENILRTLKLNSIIIRTSWLYSEYGNNFIKTMIGLAKKVDSLNVIYDQIGTPTYAMDLAKTIMNIIQSPHFNGASFKTDIFHYSNEGVCSWYDFAKTIFEKKDILCLINPIESKDYPTLASRPHFSVLNKTKIKHTFNLTIPYWKDSLESCLQKMNDVKS